MTVPYTYLLKHIPTGKFYYGCRYADKMRTALIGRKMYINKLGQKKFCFPGTEPAGFIQK